MARFWIEQLGRDHRRIQASVGGQDMAESDAWEAFKHVGSECDSGGIRGNGGQLQGQGEDTGVVAWAKYAASVGGMGDESKS